MCQREEATRKLHEAAQELERICECEELGRDLALIYRVDQEIPQEWHSYLERMGGGR